MRANLFTWIKYIEHDCAYTTRLGLGTYQSTSCRYTALLAW